MGRKKAWDLYKTGDDVELVDDTGATLKLYIRKLSGPDLEAVLRKADAARGVVRACQAKPESEDWLALYSKVVDWGDDLADLAEYLIHERLARRTEVIAAELAARDEWSGDNYLESLRDAWADGLRDRYAEDANDPEAARVFEEMKRFDALVTEKAAQEREDMAAEIVRLGLEEIRRRIVVSLLGAQADAEWNRVFEASTLFLAVVEPHNHFERHFPDIDRVLHSDHRVRNDLMAAYNAMQVAGAEGKDSPAAPASSPS